MIRHFIPISVFMMSIILSFQAFGSTIEQELFSPIGTPAAPYFLSGTLISVYLLSTKKDVSHPATKEASDVRPLGRFSKVGDLFGQVYPNLIYTFGTLGHGMFTGRGLSYYRAGHMFKATLYSSLVATVLKYTVREPRPDNIKEKNSFPSGHTTTAFTFASVVAMEHEWYWGAYQLLEWPH